MHNLAGFSRTESICFEVVFGRFSAPKGQPQISPGQSAAALAASDALGKGFNKFTKP